MSAIDKAALALTKCRKCAGCPKLEDETFRGDNDCPNYRTADKPDKYDSKIYDNWRPPK
jgi:hypothetical protein